MSKPRERRKPLAHLNWKPSDVVVVDADVHIYDGPDEIAEFCDPPWRRAVENLATVPLRYNELPGYSPKFSPWPVFPGGSGNIGNHYSDSPQLLRDELDNLMIDHGVIFPNMLLGLAVLPDVRYANALAGAYNRWLMEKWVTQAPGLHGTILVSPNDVEFSINQVEMYADKPEMVAVAMPLPGMDPLLGDSRYDPILKATEDSGLPLMLHSAAFVYPTFPHNTHRMASLFAMSTIGHGFSLMANLVNVVSAGAPEKFPGIKWVWVEAGLAWFPYIMMRLDRQYDERRSVAPELQHRPSLYFDRMYVGTQPIEEPDDFSKVSSIIELYDGWGTTLFASDWPHHDFDHPRKAWLLPTSDENKRKVMGGNALTVFGIDPDSYRSPSRESRASNVDGDPTGEAAVAESAIG